MSSTASYRLQVFDAGHPAPAADLAALHGALLAHSPVALLGPRFMKDFYYSALPEMGLICGCVAYVDDKPAGFIVATHDSSGFMRQALRRRFLKIAGVMTVSLLTDPQRAGAVWEAVQIMRNLPAGDASAPSSGELLSFGVLPEYRTREFMMRHRLRISQDLQKSAIAQLMTKGVQRIRVIVDADNREARLFYLGNGWQPGLDVVPGWRKKTVEFLWQPTTSA